MKTNNMTLLIEVVGCLVLVLLLSSSWSTIRSPVEMYAIYLRELSVFRFSTHSVFLIGNLIIIVVVVQSTKLSEQPTPTHKVQFVSHQYPVADQKIKSSGPLLYMADQPMKSVLWLDAKDEKIKFRPRVPSALIAGEFHDSKTKSRPRVRSALNAGEFPGPKATNKFLSKETRSNLGLDGSVSEQSIVPSKAAEAEQANVKQDSSQLYRRTLSASYERSAKVNRTVARPELTRSKTVKWGRGEGTVAAGRFDELNHDEFRRKIESFIAKQRRLIREELVVAGGV